MRGIYLNVNWQAWPVARTSGKGQENGWGMER